MAGAKPAPSWPLTWWNWKTKKAIYLHVISFLSCYFYVHVFIFIKFLSGLEELNLLHEQRVLHILNDGT